MVLELSHKDEGNYPGRGRKVWDLGRRLSTAEADREAASTGYESLQRAGAAGGQNEAPQLRTRLGMWAGRAFPCHIKDRILGQTDTVVGDKGRVSGVQRDPHT